MKRFILFLGMCLLCTYGHSQTETPIKAGGGVTLATAGFFSIDLLMQSGFNVRVDIPVGKKVRLIPWAVIHTQDEFPKEFEINIDAHYLINLGKRFSIYPILGLNSAQAVSFNEEKVREVGINLGLGGEWQLKRFYPFFEVKPDGSIGGDIEFNFGACYSF